MQSIKLLAVGLWLTALGVLSAQNVPAPAPPSNLRVTVLGMNAFLMEWKDNSNNEKGWEIRVSLGRTNSPNRFQFLNTPDATSYVVLTNDLPNRELSFQIVAYNGETGSEVFSAPSSAVTVKALGTSSFDAPVNMKALAIDDGRCRLTWTDRTTSEYGYQVQFRQGKKGKWADLVYTNPGTRFNEVIAGLLPGTEYFFRVRAYKERKYTAFTNAASATTKSFQAPVNLKAIPQGEGSVVLTWKDKSSCEFGYELESKTGDAGFTKLGDVGSNVSKTEPIGGFLVDTPYRFRIRAFRIVGSERVYSRYSNIAGTSTTKMEAPSGLVGKVLGQSSVRLTWNDNSKLESGFEIQSRKKGASDFSTIGNVAANVITYTATGLDSGTSYEFRVKSTALLTSSDFTPAISLITLDGITSDPHPPIFWNTSFLHKVRVSRPSELRSVAVTGLPAGLTYHSTTRDIGGKTTAEGVHNIHITVTFKSGRSVTQKLVLRVIRPPAPPLVRNDIADAQVNVGANSLVFLGDKFSDPDVLVARRFTTNLGSFDIILYPLATPGTVKNFISYVNAGRFNNTFFHRSVSDFVVQGGGYQHTTAAGYKKVPTLSAIMNEPGISNLAGTVAMAKIGGKPNSATSEFFVNLSNANAANLDYQNEGFTVFGRLAGDGLALFNQINDKPSNDYTVVVDGTSRTLEDVPVNAISAPSSLDPSQLIKITSVAVAPVLRYEVRSSQASVATAAVSGNYVKIAGLASGSSTITVDAIDLDGNKVSQDFEVFVP